jgi:hypothetical protein
MLVELCRNYCAAGGSDMRKFILPSLPVTEVPSQIYLASLPSRVALVVEASTLSALAGVLQVHDVS